MRLLALLFTLITAGFGFDLSIKKEFSSTLEPQTMRLDLSISSTNAKSTLLKSEAEELFAKVASLRICKNRGHFITPIYDYKESSKKFIHYELRADLSCESAQIEKLGEVVEIIGSNLKVTQNPIRWVVDDLSIAEAKEQLEFETINYARTYAAKLGSKSRSECTLKAIEIGTDRSSAPVVFAKMNSSALEPTKESIEVRISAEYSYECKP